MQTFTVIRVDYSALEGKSSALVHLLSSVNRWIDARSMRVLSTLDNRYIVTDLESPALSGLYHILDVAGAVYSVRLVSLAAIERLFDSSAVRVAG